MFDPPSGQTKDYKIGICCFSAKHAALRTKRNNWLARNLNNVLKWRDMSNCGLLFQWASTIRSRTKGTLSSSCQLVLSMIWLKNCSFGVKQQSLTCSIYTVDHLYIRNTVIAIIVSLIKVFLEMDFSTLYPWCEYCYEKFIFAKQFNNSIHLPLRNSGWLWNEEQLFLNMTFSPLNFRLFFCHFHL